MPGIGEALMRRTSTVVAAFGLALLCTPAHAVTISLLATPTEVASGGIVSVDIVATGFGEGEFASAYDFSISFDPLEFAFVADSFSVGSVLGDITDTDFFDFTDFSAVDAGSLLPFVSSLLSDAALAALQIGPGVVLASFELRARHTTVPLDTGIGLVCNSVSGPLDGDENAVLLDVTECNGTSVGVAPVATPEPGTLALLALGLLGIAFCGRRPNSAR